MEKIFSIHPELLINAEHYGLGPKAEKGYHHIWEANLQRETTRPLPPPHRLCPAPFLGLTVLAKNSDSQF
jgi:hypothetical protein